MSSITFASRIPEIAAYVPGCPNLVIENTLRKITIDLCQRAKVWRADLTPITLVPTVYSYTPASPVAYGEPSDLISAYTIVGGNKLGVDFIPYDTVQRIYPAWPENYAGRSKFATRKTMDNLLLVPTPDTAGVLYIYGALRPTLAATDIDTTLYQEFREVLFHGVLYDLMGLPDRSWSDAQKSMFHGRQWTDLVNQARDRAMRSYNVADLSIQMRPLA